MNALFFLLLPLALSLPSAASGSPIAVTSESRSTITVSPKGSAYPGKRWRTGTFRIQNTSGSDFYVYGHSLSHVFVQIHTKDANSGKWVSRGLGYCGTGSSLHRVSSEDTFQVDVHLPIEISEREFLIEFTRYSSDQDKKGTVTRTSPLRMKAAQ